MERKGKKMNEELCTELDKLDVLRERMGIGYEEARTALNLAEGDVMKALDNLEKVQSGEKMDWAEQDWADRGHGIWDNVKTKLGTFNKTTISVKKHDNTVLSVSAPLGLALAYTVWRKPGLRMLALLGVAGAAMSHYELEVATVDESPYNDDAFNFAPDGVDEEF